MKRTIIWIVAAAVVVLAVGAILLLNGPHLRSQALSGPISITEQGALPTHGFLGIAFVSEPIAPLTVQHVTVGTGAAQSGIWSGDVITAAENQSTPTIEELQRVIRSLTPGATVRLTILRDGAELDIDVELVEFADLIALRAQDQSDQDQSDSGGQSGDLSLSAVVAGEARIVDLTWVLNAESPYWPGENYQPFELRTIATLEEDGVLSKALTLPEHLGTHLDAPNHFEADQPSVDEIPPEDLFAPGVVIDVAPQAEQDPDYVLSVEDVRRWEQDHGPIPDRAVVLVRTGWGRFWTNYDRYKNQDVLGKMHFPGVSADAARFLVDERDVRGMGIDTLSIDPGISTDFAVHHVLNGATRYILENVARLEELAPRGFYLIIAPIKVETGTGGPARVFAVLDPT